jgi:formate--tetrahydrofolate ligase
VATIRALKYHGGVSLKALKAPDVAGLVRGLPNLNKHVENMHKFGLKPVVALNHFSSDSDQEVTVLADHCCKLGIPFSVAKVWEKGGKGATDLAQKVAEVAEANKEPFTALYDWNWPVEKKIEKIAREIYGAVEIDYTGQAKQDLRRIESLGFDKLAICIAKTQKSLSDNPKLLGRPENFVVTVRQIEIASGAGFLIPITGDIMSMPGLPEGPAAEQIDIDSEGVISGLF